MIEVNRELCDLCGVCVSVCSDDAIELTEFDLIINERKCTMCIKCVKVCPFEALSEG